ncbi:unnamed protein product, partial [Laminaria digitata]
PGAEPDASFASERGESSSSKVSAGIAAAAVAAAAAPSTTGEEGRDDNDDNNNDDEDISDEEEEEEEGEEAAAIRELLNRRDALDLKVQEAAALAVDDLPTAQRESFDVVKAFAFGAPGGGAGDAEKEEGLSEEDVLALDTVAICGDRDGVVLAFLRHSKFDVPKAKESIRRCCAWRREHEAGIFERAVPPAKMHKHRTHWPTGFHKQDCAGRPVFYDRVGQADLSALRADPDGLDQDEMVQIFCQNMEIAHPMQPPYYCPTTFRSHTRRPIRFGAVTKSHAERHKLVYLRCLLTLSPRFFALTSQKLAAFRVANPPNPPPMGLKNMCAPICADMTHVSAPTSPNRVDTPPPPPTGLQNTLAFCFQVRRRFVLTRLSRESGRPVDQMTTVLDLSGMGMRHMSKEAVSYTRRISDIFQDNYSGMTSKLLVVNAPWVFSKGWQIIEGFLSEDTVAKVKVLGTGQAGLKELERYIPRENIPEFLGGESPAVVGPTDPLWVEVDTAMSAWVQGKDPFLDRGDVRQVAARIGRERSIAVREMAAAATTELVEEEAEARGGVGAVTAGAGSMAKNERGTLERGFLERKGVVFGVGQGEGEGIAATAVAAAAAVAGRKGGAEKEMEEEEEEGEGGVLALGGSGEERAKVRVGGSKARRKADPGRRRGREGGSHRRRLHEVLEQAETSGSGSGSSRRKTKPKVNVSAVGGEGLDALSVRRRRRREDAARGSMKDAVSEKGIREEGKDREEEEGEGEAEVDQRAARGVGERVVEGLLGGLFPVLTAMFAQVVSAVVATAKVLLSAAEDVLRFLRDALFELVEVEA